MTQGEGDNNGPWKSAFLTVAVFYEIIISKILWDFCIVCLISPLFGLGDQVVKADGTVQKRILGVEMKVNKGGSGAAFCVVGCFHGVLPPGGGGSIWSKLCLMPGDSVKERDGLGWCECAISLQPSPVGGGRVFIDLSVALSTYHCPTTSKLLLL